jgi:hypothetical protein
MYEGDSNGWMKMKVNRGFLKPLASPLELECEISPFLGRPKEAPVLPSPFRWL